MARSPWPSEAQDQMALVQWFDSYARTKGIDPGLLCCSANGAMLAGDKRLRGIQMERLKKMGLRVGDPDLSLRVPRGEYHGLFIEMKQGGWVEPQSGQKRQHYNTQVNMLLALRKQGYMAVMCVGFYEAMSVIEYYIERL